jgi:hypothetical protein
MQAELKYGTYFVRLANAGRAWQSDKNRFRISTLPTHASFRKALFATKTLYLLLCQAYAQAKGRGRLHSFPFPRDAFLVTNMCGTCWVSILELHPLLYSSERKKGALHRLIPPLGIPQETIRCSELAPHLVKVAL